MKNNNISSVVAITMTVATLAIGCSKESPPPPAAQQTTSSVPAVDPAQAQTAANNAAAAVEAKTNAAVTEAAKQADSITPPEPPLPPTTAATPTAPGSPSIQAILQRVQGLVAERKYPEAMAALSELSNVNLTVEQQNLVTQLKTQITNAMAAQTGNEGLKSVGNLLKKSSQ